MKRWNITTVAIILVGMLLACGPKKPFAQTQSSVVSLQSSGKTTVLRCGALLDVKTGQVRRNVDVVVTGSKIESVGGTAGTRAEAPAPQMIDLSNMTCLPGLIDTHTHVLLQGDVGSGKTELAETIGDARTALRERGLFIQDLKQDEGLSLNFDMAKFQFAERRRGDSQSLLEARPVEGLEFHVLVAGGRCRHARTTEHGHAILFQLLDELG